MGDRTGLPEVWALLLADIATWEQQASADTTQLAAYDRLSQALRDARRRATARACAASSVAQVARTLGLRPQSVSAFAAEGKKLL